MNNILFLAVLVITQVFGDICLSLGMKQIGVINSWSFHSLIVAFGFLLTNIWIVSGVLILAFSLIIHFVVISRLDVSYVLPVHSFSYVLNALMAWSFLKEDVSSTRWLATITITLGVFLIIWIEQKYPTNPAFKDRSGKNSEIFKRNGGLLFPLGVSISAIPKLWLGTIILAFADSSGDLLTAIGIKQVGEVPTGSPVKLLTWIGRILINPFMIAGIAGYATGFAIFISLLSWADISLVRPATAVGYIMSSLGARFILREQISKGRFVGIAIIGAGIGTLSLG